MILAHHEAVAAVAVTWFIGTAYFLRMLWLDRRGIWQLVKENMKEFFDNP